jgi:tryptophan synthase alpha chain
MPKIQDKFKELKSKNEKALISYIMVGFPNENTTLSVVRGFVNGGTDIIELGFPFSDPIADGPVIQNASTISLNNGAKIEKFFKIVKKIRKETDIPLVLMTYTNVLYTHGYTKFMSKVKKAGIDGLILPDMSIEESKDYLKAAKKNNLDTIFLVSPNTSNSRLKKIANASTGFLYMVAVFGTTGVQTKIHKYTIDSIKNAKKIVGGKLPIGIGFGVSTPNDVKKYISAGVDAVIVGSANLKIIENTPSSKLQKNITEYTKKLKRSTRI